LANSPLADVRVFPDNQEKSIRFQYKEIQMNSRKWILTAALALGLTGVMAPSSFAKEREYDEQIKYSELPKAVQKTVDKERGKHEVTSFQHVMRDGKEFYRAVIDTKGDDKVIRVQPGGNLLSEQDARDVPDKEVVAKVRGGGGGPGPGARREIRLAQDETDGEIVDFDRLPGDVKKEIGRLAKSQKIHEVVRYQHRGHPVYRAEVGEGKYLRYIRVNDSGKMESIRGDIDPGNVVPFDRCPGQVKQKIGALAKSGKVDEVIEYKRGGKTYYQAEVDEKGGDRTFFYTVDADGREVEGLPRL
jgi:hypothetical protein